MSQEETRHLPLHITVLSGGDSAEREVSLESGRCVAEALKQRGHTVELFDPSLTPLEDLSKSTEIILPMLHGTGAEDGTLQSSLDRLGIPWLGSSADASRLTFDKVAARAAFRNAGLPTAPGVALHSEMSDDELHCASRSIGFPQVIKPAEQGSSVGVTIARTPAEAADALRSVRRWGRCFLVEQFIPGREVTVPVVEDCVFPAIEILPAGDWYDYAAKYSDESTGYLVAPPDLPAELAEIVRTACRVCGVTAISRTDLRVDPSGRCHILEINTIPGMTRHSLVPMSAGSLGITSGELCEQLLLRKLGRIPRLRWEGRPDALTGCAQAPPTA